MRSTLVYLNGAVAKPATIRVILFRLTLSNDEQLPKMSLYSVIFVNLSNSLNLTICVLPLNAVPTALNKRRRCFTASAFFFMVNIPPVLNLENQKRSCLMDVLNFGPLTNM